jgi:arabinofuranosyltransferase
MPRWSRSQLVTGAALAAVTLVFGILAFERRWLADDGLIVVRIVRQILAGNGPVFNVLERVEGNTSALWPWLLAALSLVTRASVAAVTVVTGWLCAVGALALAMDAVRRWHRARGSTAPLVPLGALVPLGVFAFWDYATSGLESSLCLLWIAACWWLLVQLRGPATRRREVAAAIVLGLGPLVRPDFALISAVFLAAAWLLVRPTRRRTVALVLAAAALPLAYEVFRAGYYGMLVPNPALTKSAAASEWSRGAAYLLDFIRPYKMWRVVPVFVAVAVVYRRRLAGRDAILALAPVAAAAVLAVYVVRVGGDFMHGRMMLPVCFLALAPVMLVPLDRRTGVASVLVAVWAVLAAVHLADGKKHTRADDERLGYVHFTRDAHPTDPDVYVRAAFDTNRLAIALVTQQLFTEGGVMLPKHPDVPGAIIVAGRLGASGAAAPLNAHVVDTLGLVHPLGSRITVTEPHERPGHQKPLPWAWIVAEYVSPSVTPSPFDTSPDDVAAARHAITCGELAELYAAVREPLTARRFWDNLVGAVRRTRLVIPANPRDAERALCHP